MAKAISRKYSDGKSVKIITDKAVAANTIVAVRGWHGRAFDDAASGDELVLDIEQCELIMELDSGVNPVVGDILYLDSSDNITLTATSNRPVLRVVAAKNTGDNWVTAVLLPNVN